MKIGQVLLLRSQTLLRLRQLVFLTALFKGDFYLIMGESLRAPVHRHWLIGIQLPDPSETAGLVAQTGYSVWHPAVITEWVSLALILTATVFLLLRSVQFLTTKRYVEIAAALSQLPPDPRLDALLRRAGDTLCVKVLPRLVQIHSPERGVQWGSPFLLGLRGPLLFIPPELADELTDTEMELVFRHEMAHLIRRDHWWRWVLLWVADVGSLTVFNNSVKAAAIDVEEQLCDRLAVRTPHEAVALASALQKTLALAGREGVGARSASHQQASVSPEPLGKGKGSVDAGLSSLAVPLLLGDYAASWQDLNSVRSRMTALLEWSRAISPKRSPVAETSLGRTWPEPLSTLATIVGHFIRQAARLIFFLLLAAILYAKFHLSPNL